MSNTLKVAGNRFKTNTGTAEIWDCHFSQPGELRVTKTQAAFLKTQGSLTC